MNGFASAQGAVHTVPMAAEGTLFHSILHGVERQARAVPDSVAVVDESRTLSFRDLNARANRWAHWLRSQGIGRGALVAIALDRSLEMLVSVLGVLKAGAGYVPLDPSYPRARLQAMLNDSRAALLISHSRITEALALPETPVFLIDTHQNRLSGQPTQDLGIDIEPDDLCYVIYTSGSTGTPKGVAMGHGALANLIRWQLDQSSARAMRTAQFAPLSFDVSFQEIFATWCGGGGLVVVPETHRKNPGALLALLQEHSVERLFLPYVALQQLAEEAVRREVFPACLREVITAGEQLKITPAIVNLFRALDACTLHNQYGPSETHVVTSYTLHGAPQSWPSLPPIGKPIANTEAYLLDADLRPIGPGMEGELYIGGVALANGYLHRSDLTQERFLTDPFSPEPRARMYKTGDRAAWLPSGDFQFFGRNDEQVKVRGFRVELGEIEQALLASPGVMQAAVTVRTDSAGENALAAYVVAKHGSAPGAYEIRTFLAQRLPEYLVPATVVFLDALPLTPSGKVDRRALPAENAFQRDLPTPYVEPQGEIERAITRVWQSVLQIDRVGADDNFFEMGGTSLQMIEAQRRLASAIQQEPDITILFQYPTAASLAKAVAPKATASGAPLTAAERVRRQRAALMQQGRRA